MTEKCKVLFICVHNGGRSQIAEAYLQDLGGWKVQVESAGIEPGDRVNPLVVEVMKEEGFDLSAKKPQSVLNLFKQGRHFDYVIAVCGGSDSQCPVFPGITHQWDWSFPDPAAVTGSPDEQLASVRVIRDAIKNKIRNPAEDERILF